MFTSSVGIIIPVYNSSQYLVECLNSVLNQTFSNFILVLVDDGSTDSSPQICDDFAKKDNRIVVIHKVNGGQSSARNAGLDYLYKNSTFKFITFIDSDDTLLPDHIAKLVESIKDVDIVICSFRRNCGGEISPLDSKLKETIVDENGFWNLSLPGSITIVPWNKLYRKHVFENIRYPNVKCCEDGFLIHHLIGRAKKIKLIPDDGYLYRIRSNSIMANINYRDKEYWQIQLESQLDKIRYFFKKDNFKQMVFEHNQVVNIIPRLYFGNFRNVKTLFDEAKQYYHYLVKKGYKRRNIHENILYGMPLVYSVLYLMRHHQKK